jgi:hypothetical protein
LIGFVHKYLYSLRFSFFYLNLVDKFSQPEYATSMEATPLAALFEQIKEAKTAYSIALKNSIDRNEEIKAVASATSLREPLVESYNNSYYHIQAMAHVSTDTAWGKLLASIDVLHENERAKLRAKVAVAANAAEQSKAQSNLALAAMSNTTTDTHAV